MCKAFEDHMERGRREGEASQLIFNIDNAMKNLHITLEEACEALGSSVGRYEEAKKLQRQK